MTTLSDLDAIGGASAKLWASGETVIQWDYRKSAIDGETYQRITATGSGVTDPADDATNYAAKSYRRVTALPVRSKYVLNQYNDPQYWATNATKTTPASISAGARTQLLSLTGRGRLEFAALMIVAGTPGNTRVEVLCDGRAILDTTVSAFTTGEGVVLAGVALDAWITSANSRDYTVAPLEAAAFRRSLQVWMTPTNALASPNARLAYMFSSEA